MADLEGQSVGTLVESPSGEDETSAEPGAGRDKEQSANALVAKGIFAHGGGIAIIRHVNRDSDAFRKPVPDVAAHPIFGQICLSPDDAMGGRSWHIEADPPDLGTARP